MNAANLHRRLMAEFKRSGKKSAALGLLLLVGCYFWIPPLWKRMRPNEPAPSSSAAAELATNPIAPSTAAAQQNAESPQKFDPRSHWRQLRHTLQTLAVVQPVPLDELVRDPFDGEWIQEKQRTLAQAAALSGDGAEDPLKSLICSSTLVGSRVHIAVINDRVYRVGDKVPEDAPNAFVIKEIQRNRVLLVRDENEFWLEVFQSSAK